MRDRLRNALAERGHDLIDGRLGAPVDFRRSDTAEGMLDNRDREIVHSEQLGVLTPERQEGIGADGDRRDAALLELNAVVETPRRAGPSITRRGDHHVTLTD